MQSGIKVDIERGKCGEGYDRKNSTMFRTGKPKERSGPADPKGRYPANIIHDGSKEVLDNFPTNASRFFYCAKVSSYERKDLTHPTMKPIALMEYLVTLTKTPKGGIVLDPFAGTGTTAIACKTLEREYILIEKKLEYYNMILERLDKITIQKKLF